MFTRKIGNTTITENDGVLSVSVENGGTIIIHGSVNMPAPDQRAEELNTVRQDKPAFQSSIEIDAPEPDNDLDLETEIFKEAAAALREEVPSVVVYGIPYPTPTSFPFVSISQRNQSEFRCSFMSERPNGKKAQVKDMVCIIDSIMHKHGFERKSWAVVSDEPVYDISAKYIDAAVGENGKTLREMQADVLGRLYKAATKETMLGRDFSILRDVAGVFAVSLTKIGAAE